MDEKEQKAEHSLVTSGTNGSLQNSECAAGGLPHGRENRCMHQTFPMCAVVLMVSLLNPETERNFRSVLGKKPYAAPNDSRTS